MFTLSSSMHLGKIKSLKDIKSAHESVCASQQLFYHAKRGLLTLPLMWVELAAAKAIVSLQGKKRANQSAMQSEEMQEDWCVQLASESMLATISWV